MTGFRMISPRSLTGIDQQTRQWTAKARTPETRAEIRRWSRWETVSFCLPLIGGICAFGTPLVGVGLAVWHLIHGDAPWLWWLLGSFGITALFLTAGSWLGSHASDRRLTALYADGQASVGRLDEVITHPGGGDEQTTYEFLISAELPDSVVLHRGLYWGEDDGWLSPERWAGRAIRLRHNTLDSDDLRSCCAASSPTVPCSPTFPRGSTPVSRSRPASAQPCWLHHGRRPQQPCACCAGTLPSAASSRLKRRAPTREHRGHEPGPRRARHCLRCRS